MNADKCCTFCVSPYGVCLTRGQCEHHVIARAQQAAADSVHHNGYRDPTADTAIRNLTRRNR